MLPSYSLRISVLELCQLRCSYCLPDNSDRKKSWLSVAHYRKLAKVFSRLDLDKIRFTGGEPLLRKELPEIIAAFREFLPNTTLALTTNGLNFSERAHALHQAGLRNITFHLDTLKEARYPSLMGRGSVAQVVFAIEQAKNLGLAVKLNMVVQKSRNDDEVMDFLLFSKSIEVEVRFIEMMNTGSATDFVKKYFFSGGEILAHIEKQAGLLAVARNNASDPAERFYAIKSGVIFGLIASDTRSFCAHCNRLRLSAEGKLLTCLYDPAGADLAVDAEEAEIFERLMAKITAKESFHPNEKKALRRLFSMAQTGG